MANDTDVLTSNDCDVPSSCRNSEINSLVSLNMSFDAQDVASLRSAAVCTEKLDSHIANGCVKLREREGALECQAGVDTVVCGRHTASAGDDEANAEFVDSQHSTANGLSLSPVNKYTDSQLTDGTLVHSQDATESCLNCSTAACKQTSEFSRETLLVETAQEHEESETQAEASYSSSCEQPTLASDLSNLSIADKDSGSLTVPSDDSVAAQSDAEHPKIRYIVYESEQQMEAIMQLITRDLSEPYSIYTYRYFIHNWPKLCFLAVDGDRCIGAIVCKLDKHKGSVRRGYIAMLAVDHDYRKLGIGTSLVVKAIRGMMDPASGGCDEVVLETEITNSPALRLYEKLGFVRDKRLFRYYLNGVDALRLKLWLK